MNTKNALRALLLILTALGLIATSPLRAADAAAESGQGTKYSAEGADTCLGCHDENWAYPIFPIFKTKHANRADKRTPFAGLQCEACHGPGGNHAENPSKDNINSLKAGSFVPVDQRNKVCLSCHEGNTRMAWHGSKHQNNGVACTSCHKLHAERDPVLAKATQAEACYQCHKPQRADFFKASSHPVRQGRMTCSECHSAHG